MTASSYQKLGWPRKGFPSLLLGDTLVWTCSIRHWETLCFHCLSPSLCGPLLDYKLPSVGPGAPVQVRGGSSGDRPWESCLSP